MREERSGPEDGRKEAGGAKRAPEDEFVGSREDLESILDTLPDIFYQTDRDGKITYANETSARLLGYASAKELIGKDLGRDLYVDPSERIRFLEVLKREGGVVKDWIIELWRADGTSLWVSANSRWRLDERGRITGVEGVARDVTDRIEAERRLAAQMEELETAYDRLKQAQTKLIRSEKMASLGTLVAGIAHEINNPVNFVHGNLAFMERALVKLEGSFADADPPPALASILADLREALADARQGTVRVKEIVNLLRNFSRAGTQERRERVPLGEVLRDALRLVEPEYRNRVAVALDLENAPPVRGDRLLLGQVWMNLLANAFQAIEGKGTVSVKAFRRGANAVVRIADTGRGIPASIREKVFEPFFSGTPDGVGLGLSLCFDVVHGHEGEISFESDQGEGTTFEVVLPAWTEEETTRSGA